MTDMVNDPPHYKTNPSGVEVIQINEHMGYNLGCAFKYLARREAKGAWVQDTLKAIWYIKRESKRRRKTAGYPLDHAQDTIPWHASETFIAHADMELRGTLTWLITINTKHMDSMDVYRCVKRLEQQVTNYKRNDLVRKEKVESNK